MVRKKRNPHKAGDLQAERRHEVGTDELSELQNGSSDSSAAGKEHVDENSNINGEVCFINIDATQDLKKDLFGLAEVILQEIEFGLLKPFKSAQLEDRDNMGPSLRLKFTKPENYNVKMGFSFSIPINDVFLEACIPSKSTVSYDINKQDLHNKPESITFSGRFDGPDEGVSALVSLISQGFATLRMVNYEEVSNMSSLCRIHVLVTKKAFIASDGLLGVGRQPWKKSMLNLMSWLRPDACTGDAIYGPLGLTETDDVQKLDNNFDAAAFFDAIKPSKEKPLLEVNFQELLPELRPYQRRASYWMVQRERWNSEHANIEKLDIPNPLCVAIESTDRLSKMYFNPFSGSIALQPFNSFKYVHGGILADEMGLGKTVELLACILAHRQRFSRPGFLQENIFSSTDKCHISLKRPKLERVECVCGAVTENYRYTGLWVQCDVCDAWQHADCVGFRTSCSPCKDTQLGPNNSGGNFGHQKRKRKKSSVHYRCPDFDNKSFVCRTCSELIGIAGCEVASSATLIVCPAPILHQWRDEIKRHTKEGSLRIRVYEGVKDVPCESPLETMISGINDLIDADIVLTTYDVLRSDLSHDCDRFYGDRRSMRFQKRYPIAPTPLTKIYWWRICLDEAQMVESNAAAAAEMAIRLSAKNLWCVTGTPIQKSLEDMYGLIRFLRAEPFSEHKWWSEVIKVPYEKGNKSAMHFAHNFFRRIMWRSTKLQVQDELGLPSQEERLSWLSFSAIEAQFYKRQHESCAANAHEFISKFKEDMCQNQKDSKTSSCATGFEAAYNSRLSHEKASRLLHSLLKLRQACCHPQVGSSGLRSIQQSPMTMDEILQVLIGKARTEGEEALRKCVVAMNGLAALAIIENDFSHAVSLYREALSLSDNYLEDFRLDPLLKLHILHNLAKIKQDLRNSASTCNLQIEQFPGILNDDDALLKECEDIKEKFLLQFTARMTSARQDFTNSYGLVEDSRKLFEKAGGSSWLFEVLDSIKGKRDLEKELLEKIKDSLAENRRRSCYRFRDISGLKYTIQTGMDALHNSREALIDCLLDVDKTMDNPRDADIERIRTCSKCQGTETDLLCLHCEMDELFQAYENRLFLLRVGDDGASIATAEEALDVQKQRFALNRFFGSLEGDKNSINDFGSNLVDKRKRQRQYKGSIQASRNPSELEVILNVMIKFFKVRVSKDTLNTAKRNMDVFEAMRKEFTQARQLSIAQAQVLRAHDECKMAVSRLRLRLPHEAASVPGTLCTEELVPTNVQLSSEKFVALTELSRLKGQLRYLKGLSLEKEKQRSEGSSDLKETELANNLTSETSTGKQVPKHGDETCPVCHEMLGTKLMVFPCGHLLCCNCMVSMVHAPSFPTTSQCRRVMCPTCRQSTIYENIAYVDEEHGKNFDNEISDKFEDVNQAESSCIVNGSFGTKMEAVTRRILWITQVDKGAKILVFSSWNDVLDVLEHSLRLNSINFVRMKGGSKSDVAIKKFKGDAEEQSGTQRNKGHPPQEKPVQVLLLLFRHGANGLNLLEAHHVILIEPLLNPAEEAQAINRVHRIGQKSKTYVHRFIVKDTVEESIYKLNRTKMFNPYGSFRNKKNQFILTLKDIDSLFSYAMEEKSNDENNREHQEQFVEDLRNLPPSVAAVMAAERRCRQVLCNDDGVQ